MNQHIEVLKALDRVIREPNKKHRLLFTSTEAAKEFVRHIEMARRGQILEILLNKE